MRAYVLAGGLGTRIAGLYPELPKAMVPVAGRPFIDHQLAWLAAHGCDEVVLCAGHLAQALVDHVGDGARFGVRARTVVEPAPLGTAGALAFALEAAAHPADETLLAVNGDTWCEFDRASLLAHHRALEAEATLACYRVDDARERGTVEPGPDGRLRGFCEKARGGPGWVSGGLYLLEPAALAGIGGAPASLEHDVFPRLLEEGRVVGAWLAPGRFWDMGTPAGLAGAEAALGRAATGRGTA